MSYLMHPHSPQTLIILHLHICPWYPAHLLVLIVQPWRDFARRLWGSCRRAAPGPVPSPVQALGRKDQPEGTLPFLIATDSLFFQEESRGEVVELSWALCACSSPPLEAGSPSLGSAINFSLLLGQAVCPLPAAAQMSCSSGLGGSQATAVQNGFPLCGLARVRPPAAKGKARFSAVA